MFDEFYKGKRVLVTGHTGFKGSWLCEWLLELGSQVAGLALDPVNDGENRSHFDLLNLGRRLFKDVRKDISDRDSFKEILDEFNPDIIFHLAAQSLVLYSYKYPVETFTTNVMGTVHLLEAIRERAVPVTCIVITTDKCYENKEWLYAYRENEAMGGHDTYSASKGAAEIAIQSYRKSFFSNRQLGIKLASVRAGNVIGGGDWAADRIVPDSVKAIYRKEVIPIRNKAATRPWQHVLEPLSAYLAIGEKLNREGLSDEMFDGLTSGMNFGPNLGSNHPVSKLVETLISHLGGEWKDHSEDNAPHEASKLNLAIDKAYHLLNWYPVWDFEKTVEITAKWYQGYFNSAIKTNEQISEYHKEAKKKGITWAIK